MQQSSQPSPRRARLAGETPRGPDLLPCTPRAPAQPSGRRTRRRGPSPRARPRRGRSPAERRPGSPRRHTPSPRRISPSTPGRPPDARRRGRTGRRSQPRALLAAARLRAQRERVPSASAFQVGEASGPKCNGICRPCRSSGSLAQQWCINGASIVHSLRGTRAPKPQAESRGTPCDGGARRGSSPNRLEPGSPAPVHTTVGRRGRCSEPAGFAACSTRGSCSRRSPSESECWETLRRP